MEKLTTKQERTTRRLNWVAKSILLAAIAPTILHAQVATATQANILMKMATLSTSALPTVLIERGPRVSRCSGRVVTAPQPQGTGI